MCCQFIVTIPAIIATIILAVYAFGFTIIFVGGAFGYPLMYICYGETDETDVTKFPSPFGYKASASNLLSAIMQGFCRGFILGMLWPLWVEFELDR
jgi:hypothetical protein